MILDRDTILAVSALISIVLGGILLLAQRHGRIGPWATCWGCGTFAFGVSNITHALDGVVPAGLLIAAGNMTGIIGYALIVQGTRLLAGRQPCWTAMVIGTIVVALPFAFDQRPEDRALRVAFNNLVILGADLWVAFEAGRLARREHLGTPWIMAGLFLVTVPFTAFRLSVSVATIAGHDTLAHVRVGTWLAALLAVFWSLRGVVPALIIAERAHQKLARLAFHDPLTGALNRAGLERLRPVLRHQTTAMMMDLDHFKSLDDRYGHAQGDRVLRYLADTVEARRGSEDSLIRLGGDEFLLILGNATLEDAQRLAGSIQSNFAAALEPLSIGAPMPTVSIGIASGDLGHGRLEALLSEADRPLYDAKRSGRDRVGVRFLAA